MLRQRKTVTVLRLQLAELEVVSWKCVWVNINRNNGIRYIDTFYQKVGNRTKGRCTLLCWTLCSSEAQLHWGCCRNGYWICKALPIESTNAVFVVYTQILVFIGTTRLLVQVGLTRNIYSRNAKDRCRSHHFHFCTLSSSHKPLGSTHDGNLKASLSGKTSGVVEESMFQFSNPLQWGSGTGGKGCKMRMRGATWWRAWLG